ncbi:MAG: zinc ribbon domain-containing protein [Elusimicrobia bacterium]|nr:zinc ribbon domain-containing protein [Elusimicrobiota bacterium]
MKDGTISENTKCPYCGAKNSIESKFCNFCYENLHIPKENRAELKLDKTLKEKLNPKDANKSKEKKEIKNFYIRMAIIAGLFIFYTQWLRKENYFSFLDNINLAFHEAGHIFLGFFGHFITMAGGTIFQLLIPSLCLFHFYSRGSNLGWQLCLFWIGQNFLNISIYAGDAIRQALPLVAGGVHDWTYLLTATGLIAHTYFIGKLIFFIGSAIIFLSFYFMANDAINEAMPHQVSETM